MVATLYASRAEQPDHADQQPGDDRRDAVGEARDQEHGREQPGELARCGERSDRAQCAGEGGPETDAADDVPDDRGGEREARARERDGRRQRAPGAGHCGWADQVGCGCNGGCGHRLPPKAKCFALAKLPVGRADPDGRRAGRREPHHDLPPLGRPANDDQRHRHVPLDGGRSLPDTGDPRTDLTEWANEIIEYYREPVHAALLRGGAASAGEGESDCLRNRRAEAALLAQREGATSPVTGDEVIDHLVAPIIYRVIFLPWTLTEQTAPALVARLFRDEPAAQAVTAGQR
ncbi:MAG TPA: TetR/AcrR family transcriptional regulator C-terminal ligand-binding domain-containing protein [Pseudonocardia sp.]|jgi:hypothetical protein|nr:TetR/AcrR family transcriptional regulator C-terminal ligand-binding domain-containing protein [Pseudonocardia sp.]